MLHIHSHSMRPVIALAGTTTALALTTAPTSAVSASSPSTTALTAAATVEGPLIFSRETTRATLPFSLHDLYVRRLDGSVGRLTNALAEPGATSQASYGYLGAVPNRTGSSLVATLREGSSTRVDLLTSAGHRVRTLSTGCREGHATSPVWLSDTKVLFLGHDNAQAYTVNVDGTGCSSYAPANGPVIAGVAVSADRTKVALSVFNGTQFQIAVQAANGTGRRFVTSSTVDVADPSWAPGGQRLVVRLGDPSASGGRLGTLTVPNSGTTTVSPLSGITSGWAPMWTRDGRGIYYSGPTTAPGLFVWRGGASARLTAAHDGPGSLLPFSGATTVSIPRPTAVATTGLAFPVRWGAASGVRYTIDYARRVLSAGTWVLTPWSRWRTLTTTTSGTFGASGLPIHVTPGTSYYLRVTAYDAYGSHGPAVVARAVVPYDQSASWLGYTGTWHSGTGLAGRWLGTLRTTSTRGASLTSTPTTTNLIQVVGDRCPACGQMQVYLDGVLRATVDTHASTTLTRQVLWSSPSLSFTGHRLRLVNLATATRPEVHLDAVAAGR